VDRLVRRSPTAGRCYGTFVRSPTTINIAGQQSAPRPARVKRTLNSVIDISSGCVVCLPELSAVVITMVTKGA
jgi:hypothetical protein